MRRAIAAFCAVLIWTAVVPRPADACTNLLVTKGASADGSTMITYNADSHELYGELVLIPGGVFQPGARREVIEGDSGKFLGWIPQAPSTYWVVGNINEHQVSTGETTFTGRDELKPDPPIGIDYISRLNRAYDDWMRRARLEGEVLEIDTDRVPLQGETDAFRALVEDLKRRYPRQAELKLGP